VQERRREGRQNDFKIVRIISTEWLTRISGKAARTTVHWTQNQWGNQRTEKPKAKQHVASAEKSNQANRKGLSLDFAAIFTAGLSIIVLGHSALS
jgi:hypothetical protein